jgi:GTP-binding protein YchF
MKMGLVGFPAVGKTTLFNILTDSQVETSRFGGAGRGETHTGIARVPDARLDRLAAMFSPRKTTPATIEFVDLAGLRREEADSGLSLADVRNAAALLHVVRAFPDEALIHSEGSIDPARDISTMETSLVLADHDIADKRVEKLRASIPKTNRPEEKRELEMLEKALAALEADQPLRDLDLGEDEARLLRGFAFLSAKPILHVINLGEEDVAHIADFVDHFGLAAVARRPQTALLPLSARIEQEIAQLSPADAAVFQADLGIPDPCRPRAIRASYELVGLISFFTVGEDECRAWSIPPNTPARRAAGAIHSDIEKGFIRAEVSRAADLLELKSQAALRDKGMQRLEGKEYIVADGDVINFRFNV